MGKVLTKQQLQQYHDDGFLAPIDVMSEDEALSYCQRLEMAELEYPQCINAENRSNVHLSFRCFDELVHHPIILDVVEDIIGPNISLWGTVLFTKEPQTSHFVSWHQDATYMGMNQHNFVTPWLALSPSNRETGCMSMIPGSHKQHIRPHEDTFEDDNILTRGQKVQNIDESQAVDLVLRPGQMSIHHSEVIHGSQPNKSKQRRIGFAMQSYMSPDVLQVTGKNYWLDIRGENHRDNSVDLHRPKYDLDPQSQADRIKVDANFADILYRGAKQKRAY